MQRRKSFGDDLPRSYSQFREVSIILWIHNIYIYATSIKRIWESLMAICVICMNKINGTLRIHPWVKLRKNSLWKLRVLKTRRLSEKNYISKKSRESIFSTITLMFTRSYEIKHFLCPFFFFFSLSLSFSHNFTHIFSLIFTLLLMWFFHHLDCSHAKRIT